MICAFFMSRLQRVSKSYNCTDENSSLINILGKEFGMSLILFGLIQIQSILLISSNKLIPIIGQLLQVFLSIPYVGELIQFMYFLIIYMILNIIMNLSTNLESNYCSPNGKNIITTCILGIVICAILLPVQLIHLFI